MPAPEHNTASWVWTMRIRRRWRFVHITDKFGWTRSPDLGSMEIWPRKIKADKVSRVFSRQEQPMIIRFFRAIVHEGQAEAFRAHFLGTVLRKCARNASA